MKRLFGGTVCDDDKLSYEDECHNYIKVTNGDHENEIFKVVSRLDNGNIVLKGKDNHRKIVSSNIRFVPATEDEFNEPSPAMADVVATLATSGQQDQESKSAVDTDDTQVVVPPPVPSYQDIPQAEECKENSDCSNLAQNCVNGECKTPEQPPSHIPSRVSSTVPQEDQASLVARIRSDGLQMRRSPTSSVAAVTGSAPPSPSHVPAVRLPGDSPSGNGPGPGPGPGGEAKQEEQEQQDNLLPWTNPARNQEQLTKRFEKLHKTVNDLIENYPDNCNESEYGKACKAYYEASHIHKFMIDPKMKDAPNIPQNIASRPFLKGGDKKIGRYSDLAAFNKAESDVSKRKTAMKDSRRDQIEEFKKKIDKFPAKGKAYYLDKFERALDSCHNNIRNKVTTDKEKLRENLEKLTQNIRNNLKDHYLLKNNLKATLEHLRHKHDATAMKIDEFEKHIASLNTSKVICTQTIGELLTRCNVAKESYNAALGTYVEEVKKLHKLHMTEHADEPVIPGSATSIEEYIAEVLKDVKPDEITEDIVVCDGQFNYDGNMDENKKYTMDGMNDESELIGRAKLDADAERNDELAQVAAAQTEADA